MPPSSIYQLFKKSSCNNVQFIFDMALRPAVISKLRECFGGNRRNLPFWFGVAYEGEGKQKIGLSARLGRVKKDEYSISIVFFPTEYRPPPTFCKFSQLVDIIGKQIGEKEVQATVSFLFRRNAVESIFQPFTLADNPTIFDEIIGFTGTKKDPSGKLLYQMDISVGEKHIQHMIRFRQTLRVTDDAPLALIETASKISSLALKHKEAK